MPSEKVKIRVLRELCFEGIRASGFNLFKMASLLDRDFGTYSQEGDETLLHSLLLEVIELEISCDGEALSTFEQFGLAL